MASLLRPLFDTSKIGRLLEQTRGRVNEASPLRCIFAIFAKTVKQTYPRLLVAATRKFANPSNLGDETGLNYKPTSVLYILIRNTGRVEKVAAESVKPE